MDNIFYYQPTYDENGARILPDFDPFNPTLSVEEEYYSIHALHEVAETGTSLVCKYCTEPVVPLLGVPNAPHQVCSVPPQIDGSGQPPIFPGAVHDVHERANIDRLARTHLQHTPDAQEVVLDPQLAQPSEAVANTTRVLRGLDELRGPGNTSIATYPLTRSETHPDTTYQWIVEQPLPPRITSPQAHRKDGSVVSSSDTMGYPTPSSGSDVGIPRPFPCRIHPCKLDGSVISFPSGGERNKHERHVHGSEADRPHACPKCGKRFRYPREVTRHASAIHHTNATKLPCPVQPCTGSFVRQDHLNRHVKAKHKAEWPAFQEARRIQAEQAKTAKSAGPSTPSTRSERSSSGFGLLTPPSSSHGVR